MSFQLIYQPEAESTLLSLREKAQLSTQGSRAFGLYKQINKALRFLAEDPHHPSLKTHEYSSISNPYDSRKKIFEAYAQNNTPGAYRIFWCYGPKAKEITIIAITPHP